MDYSDERGSVYCQTGVLPYVSNFTFSYTGQQKYVDSMVAPSVVATSVVMFVLAVLFFNLNLFSRLSDISAILNPSVRLFLNTALSLFLPVMSYLFSEVKNKGDDMADLSMRARTILMWMLLVEILRKKVEAILVTASIQGYSGTIERAARISWLGYLVFYNLKSAGKKAVYGTLWLVAAGKLVQRFVTLELGRRAFAYGKNPELIATYMSQVLQQQHPGGDGQRRLELLKRCSYPVMGEEGLEKMVGPRGYRLKLKNSIVEDDSSVVTVGKIWRLAETDQLLQNDPRLKRLCLSFALYKLLRRRLEDFPITAAEARNCRDLVFKGLCQEEGTDAEANAVALFQVFNDEREFLCEHYHSVLPVVFASPSFFLLNYVMFPIVMWASFVFMIILCSNGDLSYAFQSFKTDNYSTTIGIMRMTGCILPRITKLPALLFTVVDICITVLLLLTFIYEEIWEFIVFLLSNWFVVSLLCSYTSKPQWRESPFLSGVIRRILWARNVMRQPNVGFRQFSVLWFCRLPVAVRTTAVPDEAKKAIMERLASVSDVAPLRNGWSSTLLSDDLRQSLQCDGLQWACYSDGVAKFILTWHVATALLEAKHPLPGAQRRVATALSRYCAYLVAFHPELLPNDKEGTERVYKDTMAEMKKEMGCFWYYCSLKGARCDKLMEIGGRPDVAAPEEVTTLELREIEVRAAVTAPNEPMASRLREIAGRPAMTAQEVVTALPMREIEVRPGPAETAPEEEATASALREGARLGKALLEKYAAAPDDAARARVWKLVADVWTEVLVYAAPTGSELHAKAHKEALARGGEFITVLWAIATHTGIARHVPTPHGGV